VAPQEEPKPQRKSLRELVDADEEYKREFQTEVNREKQRELAKFKREREKEVLAKAVDEPVNALEYVQTRKAELDAEDAPPSRPTWYTPNHHKVHDLVESMAEDTEWATEYNAWLNEHRKDSNPKFYAEPLKYLPWLMREMESAKREAAIHTEAEKRAQVRAEAIAADLNKKQMQGVPHVPDGGSGTAGPSYRSEQDVRNALAEDKISAREARILINRFERR
jgi:hypothetical protein